MRPTLASVALAALPVLWAAAPARAAVPGVKTSHGFCDTPVVGLTCDAVGKVGDAVGSAVGGVAGWTFSQVFGAIAAWVGDGAAWLVGKLGEFISETVAVDVADPTFVERYRLMGGLALALALPLLLASVIQGVIRQDTGQILRSVCGYLPLALLVMVAGVELTRTAVRLTDWMSAAAAGGSGGDVGQALAQLGGVLAAGAAGGVPLFVFFLVAALVAFAALVLWAELLLRAAAIYACLLFLPLVLAALVWPATAHWCRRLVHTLAALILSKLVIAATLALGVSLVSQGFTDGGFNSLLTGGVLLFLAAMSPFALLRLIPVAEAAAVSHMDGRAQRGLGSIAALGGGAVLAGSLMQARGPGGIGGGGGLGEAMTSARFMGVPGPMGVAAYLAAGAGGRRSRGQGPETPPAGERR